MPETTRRKFLEQSGVAAAAVVVAPSALASARPAPARAAAAARQSPLPVGPGAPFSSYQSEIYIAGMSTDVKPIFTTNLTALEGLAANGLSEGERRQLLAEAGGAAAARANAKALGRYRIVPRMFIDRAKRDVETTVLGVTMPAPIILGPVAGQETAHPDGEPASARVAGDLGLTYVHASHAQTSADRVAAAAPTGSRWLGLDWPGKDGPDLAQLQSAQTAGYTHLVLLPPQPGESWAPLDAIRKAWDGPILLSGIQSVPDARMAVRRGFEGIVVSNERGRRGTKPTGTIDVLPRIADAVGSKVAVLFGSGVRTGPDVYRALALGAEAVFVGRPYVHGLALGGEAGVRHMLRTLLAELDITLAIAGTKTRRELDASALVRA